MHRWRDIRAKRMTVEQVARLDQEVAAMTEAMTPSDPVHHPAHYTHGPMEVIDLIEGFALNYHLGCVMKYVLRADHKGRPLEDLRKARWYLDREIARREKQEAVD